jgi:hypothetical protein
MTDNSETSRKFFELSRAYFLAAKVLNDRACASESENTNAVGSAIMFNARLSIELFLKGAIVLRDPSAKITGHALEIHRNNYARLFPEAKFAWIVPFTVQFVGGSDEERAEAQARNLRERPLDQIFRYPVDNKGQPWDTLENFSSAQFAEPLAKIGADISRLVSLMSAPGEA